MATKDRVTIELYVDDQGTIRIREAKAAVQELGQAGKDSFAGSSQAAEDFFTSMVKGLTVYDLLKEGLKELKHLTVDAFREGLKEIDNFNLMAISAAANLTNRLVVGIDKQKEAYGQYKSYVLEMYESLEEETTRHFSSGKEMIMTFNALSKMGIMATKDEAGAIGVITDQIRLLHGGYVSNVEVLHEMRGVMEGYSGIHYQLAQTLERQLGPDWHELVKEHIQAKDLVQWLGSLYPGLATAAGDIQQQWTAQKTTLDTLLGKIGRSGLGGAYNDIVDSVRRINDYLREHKDDLAVGIAKSWATIQWLLDKVENQYDRIQKTLNFEIKTPEKPLEEMTMGEIAAKNWNEAWNQSPNKIFTEPLDQASWAINGIIDGFKTWDKWIGKAVEDVKDLNNYFTQKNSWGADLETPQAELDRLSAKIQSILDILTKPVTWVINWVMSGPTGSKSGFSGVSGDWQPEPKLSFPDTSLAAFQELARQQALGVRDIMMSSGRLVSAPLAGLATEPPPTKPPNFGGGGGGGGAEKGIKELMNIIDGLDKEYARLTQGIMAENDQWIDHLKNRIEGAEKVIANPEEARQKALELGQQVYYLRQEKLEDDYQKWLAGASNDTQTKIGYDRYEMEKKWRGDERKLTEINAVFEQKLQLDAVKKDEERLNLQKSYLSGLASSAPFLSQQLMFQGQVLAIEEEIGKKKLEQDYLSGKLGRVGSEEALTLRTQLDALRAQTAEYQRQALLRKQWETGGIQEGLQLWSLDRLKQAETTITTTVVEAMKRAETAISSSLSDAVSNALFGGDGAFDPKKMRQELLKAGIQELFKFTTAQAFTGLARLIPGAGGLSQVGQQTRTIQLQMTASNRLDQAALKLDSAATHLMGSGGQIDTSSHELAAAGAGQSNAATESLGASMAQGMAAGSLVLGGLGMVTGSQTLMTAAMAISMAAALLEIAAAMDILPFHSGGVVAHHGLLVAHSGLNLDERNIRAQVGEWVINKDATAALQRQGINFDMVNSGRYPVVARPEPIAVPGPMGGENGRPIQISFGDLHVNVPVSKDFSGAHARKVVRKHIIPAIEDELSRKGLKLGSS